MLKSTIHLLFLNHGASLRDVDTIQKLTDILLSDVGALLNVGGGQRHLVDVNTGELDLILHIGGTHEGDTVQKGDTASLLLSQKVTDLNNLVGTLLDRGDVDGEMGVTETHLVLESLGDTGDHVLDVRSDGSDGSDVLSVSEPNIDLKGTSILSHRQVHGEVLEGTLEGSEGTGHLDGSSLELNLDCEATNIREAQRLIPTQYTSQQLPHSETPALTPSLSHTHRTRTHSTQSSPTLIHIPLHRSTELH